MLDEQGKAMQFVIFEFEIKLSICKYQFVSFGPLSIGIGKLKFCFVKNKLIFVINHYLLIFQGYVCGRLNLSDGRVERTSQEIFTNFWNKFGFVPHMTYDMKAIIWYISFIDIFWVNKKSIFL